MLFTPIRYVNNGEALDQETLNRAGFDFQANIEEIISRLGAGYNTSVNETPDTVALRDANGTTKFAPAVVGENPLRLMDANVEDTPDAIVKRDETGLVKSNQVLVTRAPVANLEVATKKYVDDLFNSVSANEFTIVSGSGTAYAYSNSYEWDATKNHFDIYPPSGKTMANLVAFIPSIRYIYFNGNVDNNDKMRCVWTDEGDRIRVHVQNTEQRSHPQANWLAIWR